MADQLDVHALVAAVAIESVSFLELNAKRADEFTSAPLTADEEFDVEPEMSLQIGRGESGKMFRVRVRVEIDTKPGTVLVDGAVEYSVRDIELAEVSAEVMLEFANKVGVFALLPYLRQAIADMTQRVFGTPLTMPVYRQGDVDFGLHSEEEPKD